MITLNLPVFLGLIELLLIALIGAGLLFWRWRRLRAAMREIALSWEESRNWCREEIARFAQQKGGEGPLDKYKYQCLKALSIPLQEQLPNRRAWEQAFTGIACELDGLGKELEPTDVLLTEVGDPQWEEEIQVNEPEAVEVLPDEFTEMEKLVNEQDQKISSLLDYQESMFNLVQKFQQTNLDSQKLRDFFLGYAGDDEKLQALKQLMLKLEEEASALQIMVNKMGREKDLLEPRLESLRLENQRLADLMKNSKTVQARLVYEKAGFQERINKLHHELEARTKSFQRLRGKFVTLRQEYMNLYKITAKGKAKNV